MSSENLRSDYPLLNIGCPSISDVMGMSTDIIHYNAVKEEPVDDVLLRAERLVLESRALIDASRDISNFSEMVSPLRADTGLDSEHVVPLDEMVRNAIADADRTLDFVQDSALEDSIIEILDVQRPIAHIVSDGEDDDDVIFVAQVNPPRAPVPVVDLCVDSPAPAPRPATPMPFDEIQDVQVVNFLLDHTEQASTSASSFAQRRRRPREFNPMVRMMAQQLEENATASAVLGSASALAYLGAAAASSSTASDGPESPKRSKVQSANNKQINCAICLEPPFDNRPAATVCGHVFCHNCIMMAIKQCKKCPMCNRKLSPKSVHMLYI